jgi:Predicted hydrolases or acyltransferases (alpha/beta hydrolase superfamily)
LGFSLGALIAQHFAANFSNKINKLIIIASVFNRSQEQKLKVKKRYEKSLSGKSISDDSIKRWFNLNYLNKNPLVYKFFFNILKNNNPKDFLPAYKLFVESDNYKINFLNIKKPTLVITGENDIGSTPRMSLMLSKKIKKSKIYIIKNAKHMGIYEKSKIVNLEIEKFISN